MSDTDSLDHEDYGKRPRSSKACETCRKKRVKCSGDLPCSNCLSYGVDCVYPPSKKRGPMNYNAQMKALEDKVDKLYEIVNEIIKPTSKTTSAINPANQTSENQIKNRRFASTSNPHTSNSNLSVSSNKSNETITPTYATPDEGFFIQKNQDSIIYIGNSNAVPRDYLKYTPRYHDGVLVMHFPTDPRTFVEVPEYMKTEPCNLEVFAFLSEVFFKTTHLYLPMVDKTAFIQLLNSFQPPEGFQLLKYAVCACATQYCTSLPTLGIQHTHSLRIDFLKRIRTILPNHMDKCNHFIIQACLLLSYSGVGCSEDINPSTFMGMAVKMSFELGLYRSECRLKSPTLKETYRRTWSCAVILDAYTSFVVGRPLMIRSDEWDTPLPDWSFPQLAVSSNLIDPGLFKIQMSLLQILGQILSIGNHCRNPLSNDLDILNYNKEQQIDHVSCLLHDWFLALPLWIREVMTGKRTVAWGLVYSVACIYLVGKFLLLKFSGRKCTPELLNEMLIVNSQIPAMDFQKGVYVPPYILYFNHTLGVITMMQTVESPSPFGSTVLSDIIKVTSTLEPFYTLAYKQRMFIKEVLTSKNIDPVQLLGAELCAHLPIGVNPHELCLYLYQPIFINKLNSVIEPVTDEVKPEEPDSWPITEMTNMWIDSWLTDMLMK